MKWADTRKIWHPKRFTWNSTQDRQSTNNKIGTHHNLSWRIEISVDPSKLYGEYQNNSTFLVLDNRRHLGIWSMKDKCVWVELFYSGLLIQSSLAAWRRVDNTIDPRRSQSTTALENLHFPLILVPSSKTSAWKALRMLESTVICLKPRYTYEILMGTRHFTELTFSFLMRSMLYFVEATPRYQRDMIIVSICRVSGISSMTAISYSWMVRHVWLRRSVRRKPHCDHNEADDRGVEIGNASLGSRWIFQSHFRRLCLWSTCSLLWAATCDAHTSFAQSLSRLQQTGSKKPWTMKSHPFFQDADAEEWNARTEAIQYTGICHDVKSSKWSMLDSSRRNFNQKTTRNECDHSDQFIQRLLINFLSRADQRFLQLKDDRSTRDCSSADSSHRTVDANSFHFQEVSWRWSHCRNQNNDFGYKKNWRATMQSLHFTRLRFGGIAFELASVFNTVLHL
jgi:hypothetical protein